MSDQPPKETIRAGRRRKTETAPESRPRAEAPRRRVPSFRPTTSGGGGGSGQIPSLPIPSLSNLPKGSLPIIVLLGVVACCVLSVLYFINPDLIGSLLSAPAAEPYDQQTDTGNPPPQEPEDQDTPSPTRTPRPTSTPASPGSAADTGQTWTVLLYQDADDKVLEQDIFIDLNEAERTGSTDQVHIVAQVDRFQTGFQGDGDWTSTRRYLITQDDDLNRINSDLLADLGEANMSSGATLVDFVTWAMATYPADKYALILSDHGMGWPGGWSDPAPGGRGPKIPLASKLGDQLYLMEIDQSLEKIRSETGLDKFELIGMDACLMGHLEVMTALQPHARYAVLSQEVEPSLGWAYTGFLDALVKDPAMNGADLGSLIVDSYIEDDQRIVDDRARAEFTRQGGLFGLQSAPSRRQLADQLEQTVTLAAVDLARVPDLNASLNDLAFQLQTQDQAAVAKARSYAQSFTSIFGNQVPASYIDLGSFVQLLKREAGPDLAPAIDVVRSALNEVVIAEKHGAKKPGATGVSVYFPNSQLYSVPAAGPESYLALAERFAQESLWDDFLAFHYTNQSFAAQPAPPTRLTSGVPVQAPGQGKLTISQMQASADVIDPSEKVLLSADIKGQKIGYVHFFLGFKDSASNSIFIADMDYLESPDTRQVDGVYYPVWGKTGDFRLEYEWEPVVFAISDGSQVVAALFRPQSYGAIFEEAVYTVDGIYTFTDGTTQNARLYFSNGTLRNIYGFTGQDETGAPREILPTPGDQFTLTESWLDVNAQGATTPANQAGATLTFGSEVFTWQELTPAAGQYVLGFIVTDLDGNAVQAFTDLEIR